MSAQLLSDEQRRDWLRLIKSENVGPVTFIKLINRFGGASQAIEALPNLSGRGGLKRAIKICTEQDAEKELIAADNIGAQFIAIGEPNYPAVLRNIDGAPPLICAKGRFELLNKTSIAIVGSRNASAVGLNFAQTIAGEFGHAGYITVSGLARGIDTTVHIASLETGTIAVVAGGIDIVYPPENADLHQQIFDQGVVISEMMPGIRPQARHFPRRNRLISGISRGTVVVEAAMRSGSLITARLANEQNREVFAVPGSPLDPRAGGTNKLIKDGAILITGSQDVVDVIRDVENRQIQQFDFFASNDENYDAQALLPDINADMNIREKVVNLLSPAPTSINDLVRLSSGDIATVHTVLLELELAGRLERHTGQRVSLI